MKIEVNFDEKKEEDKIKQSVHLTQAKFDAQVLKDSNRFCPFKTGAMFKSAIIATKLGSGEIIWDTEYAREQYYSHPNKSHQQNPNATMMWFETAKVRYSKDWEVLAQNEFSKNFK